MRPDPTIDRLAIIGAIGFVLAGVVGYFFYFSSPPAKSIIIEFVSAHAAAAYELRAGTLVALATSTSITELGPVTGAGGYAVSATLARAPLVAATTTRDAAWPPFVIAPPEPVWTLSTGGIGRPVGIDVGGAVLALTPAGLVRLTRAGATVVIAGGSNDLVGAVSADATLAALENPLTHAIDLYALSLAGSDYLSSIATSSTALAFSDSQLLSVGPDHRVDVYAVSPTSAQPPQLVATIPLPTASP